MRRLPILLLLASGCAEEPGPSMPQPDVKTCPPLLRSPIDFGEQTLFLAVQETLELVNPNRSSQITVSVSPPSFPFFTDLGAAVRLNPGARVPLRVVFVAPDARQHFGSLTYNRGEGCEAQLVTLTGQGAGRLEAVDPVLDFGALPLDVTATRVLQLRNTRRQTVKVELRAPALLQLPRTVQVPALSTLDVPVNITPRAGDNIATTIQVLGAPLDERGLDSFVVAVTGRAGRPVISIERDTFVAEQVPLDGWLMRRFLIHNTGDGPSQLALTVLGAVDGGTTNILNGASISNVGVLEANSSVSAFLHLRAARPGFSREQALLTTEDPLAPRLVLTVEGTGVAVGACGPAPVTVSPGGLVWQPPMFPAQQVFTFSNSNNEDCLLDSIEVDLPVAQLGLPNAWHLSPGRSEQALVPAGGTATLTVEFEGPGDGWLRWNMYVAPFIQNGRAPISIAP